MKRLAIATLCAVILVGPPAFAQQNQDAPEPVLRLLDRAAGSWYFEIGTTKGACTINLRANGRCVSAEGRRFDDAIAFTSLLGWYAAKQQVVGLIIFENGESLLVRATIRDDGRKLTAKGDVVGILRGAPVRTTFIAVAGEKVWSMRFRNNDGQTIQGALSSTNPRR